MNETQLEVFHLKQELSSREHANRWTLKEVSAAGLFAALTAVGALITIPLPWVPLTLQVLFTLLSGAVLGPRVGVLSQAAYVLMGVVGLPVFAGRGAGIQQLVGPTGGYLIGMVLAPWIVGRVLRGSASPGWGRSLSAMLLGLAVIHVAGIIVLSFHVGSIFAAVTVDVVFLPVDLLKALAALTIARGLKARGVVMGEGEQP